MKNLALVTWTHTEMEDVFPVYFGNLKKYFPEHLSYNNYILIDKCKKVFGLQDMNMVRILSDKGQLKIDPTKKSYVNNVKIGDKNCVYCMMDYFENIGDLGKNKDMMNLTLYSDPNNLF